MTKKERYYIDTSVIGGCLDDEFRKASKLLIKEFSERRKVAIISDITRAEISRAPKKVRQVMDRIPEEFIEGVTLSEESNELSRAYLKEKVISKRFLADSQHIAIATVAKADIIISWNFKHIVNIERIRGYNSVNIKKGYGTVEIRSPWEVVGYD
ncbi:MAG: PIN domain protein [Thermoplasmatota archaeon]